MGSVRYLLSFLVVTAIWLGSAAAAEAQKVSIVLGHPAPGSAGTVAGQVFNNTTCAGTAITTTNLPLGASVVSVPVTSTQSVRLTAPATAVNGGPQGLTRFNHWSSSTPFSPITGPRDVCVPGPPSTEVYTLQAFYEPPQLPVTPVVCSAVPFTPFPTSPFASGDLWKGLTIADVDGDGNNDLVAGSQSNDRLEIRYGNGHGGFTPP